MNIINASNAIRADGEYEIETAYQPGSEVLVEVEGNFGGGTVAVGYRNLQGAFRAYDVDALSAGGGLRVDVPRSGRIAVKLAGATNPAVLVGVTRTGK